MKPRTRGGPLGIGIVGLGMVATPHVLALAELPEVRVLGVFSRDEARRTAFAAGFGLPAARSLDELIATGGIDALILLTPPNARIEIIEAAARAGLSVLVEKPLARNTAEARRIVEIAERAGITLGVVFQNRFRPAVRALKQLVADGQLGAIAAVRIDVPWWRPQSYYDTPGRGTLSRDGGGVLISQAIHTLDLALWIAGPVAEVQAIAATTRLHRMEGEDFVAAGLVFANGAPGALSATTAAYPGAAATLTIEFERGSARLEGGLLTYSLRDGIPQIVGDQSNTGAGADPMAFSHEWHRALIGDFVAAINEGRKPAIDGREALEVHRLIDALMLSARTRRSARPDEIDNQG